MQRRVGGEVFNSCSVSGINGCLIETRACFNSHRVNDINKARETGYDPTNCIRMLNTEQCREPFSEQCQSKVQWVVFTFQC